MNLITVFFTGLFTGGLSCLAVQGGLLAATIAQQEEKKLEEQTKKTGHATPILFFLLSKIIAYTILGFLLGWLGSLFELSLNVRVFMQFIVVFFMLGTALNLLNVHPIFRYFIIQPPKFLTRLIRRQSKRDDVFAPLLLGAFTVFIPCGTTQAMMALAIASGKPFLGAATLFSFTLGTSPVFFLLGYLTTRLGETLQKRFMQVAAYAIILLAIFNLNSAISLTGSSWTIQNLWEKIDCTVSFCKPGQMNGTTQEVKSGEELTITFLDSEYTPNSFSVKAGSHVTLRLVNKSGSGCIQAFTIPKLGIQKVVRVGQSDVVEFTAPLEKGELAFMCSMGMYSGKIQII